MGSIDTARVEEYLAKNPEFIKKWILKNIKQEELEGWVGDLEGNKATLMPTTFHARNSITTDLFQNFIAGKRSEEAHQNRDRQALEGLSEKDLFMELIRDIANELDVNRLCHKILLNVSILTKGDRGSLFLVRGSQDSRVLVSKLFDVTENSRMEDCLHTEENEVRVPFGKGIAGTVALTKNSINIKDAYEDPRFNKEVDLMTGYRTRSILCMPIFNYNGDVIGVAQIMNKTDGGEEFTKQDEKLFRNYLTFCGIGLTNAQLFEMSVQEYKRNQLLLKLAKGIFEEQNNLDNLVEKIILEAQELLKAERCCVYLVDDTMERGNQFFTRLFAKVLHQYNRKQILLRKDSEAFEKHENAFKAMQQEKNDDIAQNRSKEVVFFKVFEMLAKSPEKIYNPSISELDLSPHAALAKDIVRSGELLNVEDVMSHPKFKGEVVDYNGFKTRSLLAIPILNREHKTIGVVQLMNKLTGRPFNSNDVNILEAFAIFCGLGIYNCQMYENACKLMAKQSVALEVLSYHATAAPDEVDRLKSEEVPPAEDFRLYTFNFSDFEMSDFDTCKAVIRMFSDCNFITNFHVPYDVLCRWVLSVKKNYRPVTYHNWRHAFNVAQSMFTMLHTGNMFKVMSGLEALGLLTACLCHDLDHRGTNNAFQAKIDSPLALLYSTSTMEHHHFDHCIMILNSEGNNIFQHLTPEDYRAVIKIVEGAIISTDLALYFKKRKDFQDLVEKGERKWSDFDKRGLLRGMMMTACDVAAITKPWEVQKHVAKLVAGEFFEQGDIERSRLNMEPIAMMDRGKKDELPKMQVGFIDSICMPLYKLLSSSFPGLKPLLDGCVNNRENWQNLSDKEDEAEQEHLAQRQSSTNKGTVMNQGPVQNGSIDANSQGQKSGSREDSVGSRKSSVDQKNRRNTQKSNASMEVSPSNSDTNPDKKGSKTCVIL